MEYELVTRKLTWGEDRVFYYDQTGTLKSFLTNMTDLVPADAFRAAFGWPLSVSQRMIFWNYVGCSIAQGEVTSSAKEV